MKIYDLLWKRSENKGKARWERVGILMDKDGKLSVKIDGCTPDITSQIRENDGLGKKTKRFPSDCSESKIEG
jgi:hypothetical protein